MSKNEDKSKPKTDTVEIDFVGGRKTVARTAKICAVYMGQIGPADDPQAHESAMMFASDGVAGLTLEAGATQLEAGLLADHMAAGGNKILALKVERGEIKVYGSAVALLDLPVGELRRIIGLTRHGAVLRQLEVAEAEKSRPRPALSELLKERLRLYRDYAPPQADDLANLVPARKAG